MLSSIKWFGVSFLLFFSATTIAQTAEMLVKNMGQAFRTHNYQGYLTYEYGSKIESFEVVHVLIDGHEYEKISNLTGSPSDIIRSGHALECLHSGNLLLRHGFSSSQSQASPRGLALPPPLIASYQFVLKDDNRVAGRDVSEVHVIPRDTLRNGFKLFLDKDTGLMLKTIIMSPEGKVLERFQFVHIEIDPELDLTEFESANQLAVRAVAHGSERVLKQGLSFNPTVSAKPAWLPSGFVLSEQDHQHEASSMMLYSDGLATVSVLLEKSEAATDALVTDGRARRGSMVAYTRPVLVDGEKFILTVMGELPLFTAARIARHMKFLRRTNAPTG